MPPKGKDKDKPESGSGSIRSFFKALPAGGGKETGTTETGKENSNKHAAADAPSPAAEKPLKRLRRAVVEDSPSPGGDAAAPSGGQQQPAGDGDCDADLMDDDCDGAAAPASAAGAAAPEPAAALEAADAAEAPPGAAASAAAESPALGRTAADASATPAASAADSKGKGAAREGGGGGGDSQASSQAASQAAVAASIQKLASMFAKPTPKASPAAAAAGAPGAKSARSGVGSTKVGAKGPAKAGAGGASTSKAAAGGKKPPPAAKPKASPKPWPQASPAGKAKGGAKTEADDDDDEEDEGSNDVESVSDEDEDELEDGDDEGGAGKKKDAFAEMKKGAKKASAAAKGKGAKKGGASEVEGVGAGAIAAAAKHAAFDVDALVAERWKAGAPVPFEFLADTFEAISETSKRLELTHILICCFRAILATTPEDLLPAIYLCSNKVAPSHHGIELGVGESTIVKAIAASTGRTEARIKEQAKTDGDLGIVAVKLRATQTTLGYSPRLSVRGVLKAFRDIAAASGKASQKVKEGLIVKMLAASKGNEPGYVIRFAQAKLRIGLAEQSVLTALSHAVRLQLGDHTDNKDGKLADRLEIASQIVKQAFSECPSYDVLVPALLAHPLDELPAHCHFMPGVPVKPMLAKPTNGVTEVLDKFQDSEFTCEYKYDGERAQVHVLENGSVHIYSRNSEDNTGKYPDIVARFKNALKPGCKSIVLDTEAVAWDKVKKKILPFQVLSTRKRKDVDADKIDVQVCVFAFDCLYINGRSLLKAPLEERREALYGALETVEGEMQFATAMMSRDIEELQRFLDEAVDGCTEGLIVKTMRDTYEPSKRSSHWLKLKKDYLEGVGDTIDVVPIGAWHGKGKRTGVFGAYLLAIYDAESECYQTISKIGTGFKDEMLQELTDTMTPNIIPGPKRYFSYSDGPGVMPDVWFDACVVWEVKAADLSISPVHKAASGLVDSVKGISIRFPRLIRVRDDKSPEDATSAAQIADMFRSQVRACVRGWV
ncbi:hypothetical protein FOA52_006335 [Chlamydomonas sp. UWO 241]|nr:hypothetical protein FOA52_006335 [Chlamydomonas sp. UWO 241]